MGNNNNTTTTFDNGTPIDVKFSEADNTWHASTSTTFDDVNLIGDVYTDVEAMSDTAREARRTGSSTVTVTTVNNATVVSGGETNTLSDGASTGGGLKLNSGVQGLRAGGLQGGSFDVDVGGSGPNAYALNTPAGSNLGFADGQIMMADGSFKTLTFQVKPLMQDGSVSTGFPNQAGEWVSLGGKGIAPEGAITPSSYILTDLPAVYQSGFGPTLAAWDAAGQGYLVVPIDAIGNMLIMSPPAGYTVPALSAFEGAEFQALDDQKVLAGTYDRFNEFGNAVVDVRIADVWGHVTYQVSGPAAAANALRLNPPLRLNNCDSRRTSVWPPVGRYSRDGQA